jgi:hypothetical protein
MGTLLVLLLPYTGGGALLIQKIGSYALMKRFGALVVDVILSLLVGRGLRVESHGHPLLNIWLQQTLVRC